MDFFRSTPRQPPAKYLLSPPPRQITIPVADRLSTIMENQGDRGDRNAAPPRSPNLNRSSGGSARTWETRSRANTLPRFSEEQKPPPYAKFTYTTDPPMTGTTDREKTGILGNTRRGGWGRLLAIIAIVLLAIIALAVGLGVGLTRHHKSSSTSSSAGSSSLGSSEALAFPVGQYSFMTALSSQSTNCTSNAATWRCYPYETYDSSSTGSEAVFNWILTNTSATYAGNKTTPTTDSAGIPANMSISSTDNPFSISISNQSLTYINNDSHPRYYF